MTLPIGRNRTIPSRVKGRGVKSSEDVSANGATAVGVGDQAERIVIKGCDDPRSGPGGSDSWLQAAIASAGETPVLPIGPGTVWNRRDPPNSWAAPVPFGPPSHSRLGRSIAGRAPLRQTLPRSAANDARTGAGVGWGDGKKGKTAEDRETRRAKEQKGKRTRRTEAQKG